MQHGKLPELRRQIAVRLRQREVDGLDVANHEPSFIALNRMELASV